MSSSVFSPLQQCQGGGWIADAGQHCPWTPDTCLKSEKLGSLHPWCLVKITKAQRA